MEEAENLKKTEPHNDDGQRLTLRRKPRRRKRRVLGSMLRRDTSTCAVVDRFFEGGNRRCRKQEARHQDVRMVSRRRSRVGGQGVKDGEGREESKAHDAEVRSGGGEIRRWPWGVQ